MRRRTAVQMLGTLALMAPTAGASLLAQGEKKEEKEAAPPAPALKVGDDGSRLHPARPDI